MQVDDVQLGSFLVDARLLSRGQLESVVARTEDSGISLYDALLVQAVVPEDELRRAAAHVLGVPFVILEQGDISPEALLFVPEPLARSHSLSAFRSTENTIEVILLDLDDLPALQFLEDEYHLKILPRLTDRGSLKRALLSYQKLLKEKFSELVTHGEGALDALIHHALLSRAGGVHLDLSTTGMLVRYRINHTLHEAMHMPAQIGAVLSQKLKSLAKLFPSVSGLQEGRFKIEHAGERVAVHVSTQQTAQGEKMVLRFARESFGQSGFSLTSLGFHGEALEHVHEALRADAGLVVVSGPEGSGKTTTLYTLLDLIAGPHRAIATVENNIEQHLPHVAQVQFREGSGISYAAAVRSALRQDPDVLMISDLRDGEVAALALSAAARGVLVLAGLETPAVAALTIEQLLSFGISSIHLASTLRLIIAPCVLDRLCPHCGRGHHLSRIEGTPLEARANFGRVLATLKEEKVIGSDVQWKEVEFTAPEGCKQCDNGYKGLIGLQEVLPITAPIKELILRGEGAEAIDQAARQGGMMTLVEDGLFKAAQGQTSIEQLRTLI